MRLDFNVLWVEDLQDEVQDQKERLETLIRKEGFRLRVKFASSVTEATTFISDSVFGDHVDLILMDYNLGAGPNGDVGLVQIRGMLPYKEMIFYSAQANNLRDLLKASNVEGVYLSDRNDLPSTAEGIFQALVKKVLDIDHSRGIVMGATSDIDHFVNDCIVAVFKSSNDDVRKGALVAVLKRMKEIRERFEEAAKEIEAIKDVSELFDKHAVYSSVDRLNLLRKLLKLAGLHQDKEGAMKRYISETVPLRNNLAHVRVKIDGFSRKLIDLKGKELTSDEMKKLRLELLEHQEIFESLFEALHAPAS
jgi:CheY-like chemotaxis protein